MATSTKSNEDPFHQEQGPGGSLQMGGSSVESTCSSRACDSMPTRPSMNANGENREEKRESSSSTMYASCKTGLEYSEVLDRVSVVSTSKKIAEEEKLRQLTSNRIRQLDKGTLYGREEEKAKLRAYLDSILENGCLSGEYEPAQKQETGVGTKERRKEAKGRRALVLVKGYSGTGKTALVATLRYPVMKQHGGLHVSGKFDFYLKDAQPYCGIVAACREICREIVSLKGTCYTRIREELMHNLGPDIHLLAQLIPGLTEILGSNSEERNSDDVNKGTIDAQRITLNTPETSETHQDAQKGKAKFHYIFRTFIHVITSYCAPLVMALDDLQWADIQSLELIKVLLTDRDNSSFMVVGMYRSNEVEVDENHQPHILGNWVSEMKEKINDAKLDVLEMEVGNLSVDAVKSIAIEMLSVDDDDSTKTLAELLHKRTQGNSFFLVTFITMLENEGFLIYDLYNGRHTWDIKKLETETGAASNVVDMMNTKMAGLPENVALLLSLAGCLGSTFELAKLEVVWRRFANERLKVDDIDTRTLVQMLSLAIEEGFVEETTMHYKWSHDRVQETALTLIPAAEQPEFKFQIGEILCKQLSTDQLDASIFLVVNLLNSAAIHSLDGAQQVHIAMLNLQASLKAMSFSAFSSAAKFSGRGIDLLPADSWTTNYRLTLKLYSCAVEAEDCMGNDQKLQSYYNTILTQKICPLDDKLRVYNVMVSRLTSLEKTVEATELSLKVLNQLKVKFPKSHIGRLVATTVGLAKMKILVQYRTGEEIAKLPIMKDPTKVETMTLLSNLGTCAYLCGSDLFLLIIMKMVNLMLQQGLSDLSPITCASLVIPFTGILGDPVAGTKIGEYALLLLDKVQSRKALASTKILVYNFGFTWTKPFQNLCSPLFEAYKEGLACGDTESAMTAILFHLEISSTASRPLKQIVADCSNYSQQMIDLKRQITADFLAMLWQQALNLMGSSSNTTTMQGEVIASEEEFFKAHGSHPGMLAVCRAYQLKLCAVFGEFEKGSNIFITYGNDFPRVAPASPAFMTTIFSGGLCCFVAARATKRGIFKKHAAKARSTLKRWVSQGNPNVKHCLALLSAESAAASRKYKAAETQYQLAISCAARSGFVNDAALGCERYGEFMLSVLLDKEGAKYYFENAIKYYDEWGATRKIDLLREKHAKLLQS